jgi:hypothetical protein
MKHYYQGVVKDGRFALRSRKGFDASIKYYKDGEYLVALYSMREKDPQEWRQFYFAVLNEWSLDTGYTKEELHEMVKDELFPELFDGETSTSQLTNTQWNILFLNLEPYLILKFENK